MIAVNILLRRNFKKKRKDEKLQKMAVGSVINDGGSGKYLLCNEGNSADDK